MLRVVITMRTVVDSEYKESRDCLSEDWSNYLFSLHNDIQLTPLVNQPESVERFLENIKPDLLILSNGNDLHSNERRDKTELKAINYAMKNNISILGVCRGMQILNYFFGGNIEKKIQLHVTENHEISVVDKGFQKELNTTFMNVNSYHNQGIKISGLSDEFNILGVNSDIVEIMKHKSKNILGIQWHPERPNRDQELNDNIIRSFIENILKDKKT